MAEDFWSVQLNTKTVNDLDTSAIDTVFRGVNITESNLEGLNALDLLNKISFRDGRPIPGTAIIQEVQATESGTRVHIKRPNEGEVWQLQSAQATSSAGGSGNIIHEFYFGDDNGNMINWFYKSSSSTNLILNQDDEWAGSDGPVFDENLTLFYEATRTSLTNSTILLLMHRIR